MNEHMFHERSLRGRLLSLIASAVLLFVVAAPSIGADASAEEAEVLKLDQKFGDAVVAGDVAAVDRMLSPDFTMVHGDQWTTGGKPFLTDDKKSFLERVANRQYGEIRFEPVKAEMHGDVAITYGRYVASLRANAGTDRAWFRVWYERVYVKRDGRWQFASHRTVDGPVSGPDRAAVSAK